MGYIVAFFIFFIVVYVIGVIFSFLWPIIFALILVAVIGNILAYQKRKKQFKEFYKDPYSAQSYTREDTSTKEDVIDVEFSEQEVDDQN